MPREASQGQRQFICQLWESHAIVRSGYVAREDYKFHVWVFKVIKKQVAFRDYHLKMCNFASNYVEYYAPYTSQGFCTPIWSDSGRTMDSQLLVNHAHARHTVGQTVGHGDTLSSGLSAYSFS
jgi:hypothetical protein